MARFKILTFEKYSLYFMSVVMALGTINPLNLGGSTRDEEVQSFLIYPALLLVFLSFIFDKDLKKIRFKSLTTCTIFLFLLCLTIFAADLLYGIKTSFLIQYNYIFFIKLLMCVASFFILALLFIRTKDIDTNLLLYSIIMVIVVLPFFTNIGIFSHCFEFSNGRLWMYGENPNTFSARLAIAILFFSYALTQKKYKIGTKIIFIAFIILLFYFVILSGSRGSLAIVGLSLLYLFLRKLSIKQIILIMGPVLAIVTIVFIRLADSDLFIVFERFQSLSSKGDLREVLMAEAIDIWKTHPILGCGNNGYNNEKLILFNEHLDSHCIATSIMAMSGIVGICWFGSFIITLFKYVWKSVRISPLPLIMCIFMLAVSLKTGGIITYFLMYYIYAICIADSKLLTKRSLKQRIDLK